VEEEEKHYEAGRSDLVQQMKPWAYFLLPEGRPGRRFVGADDEATAAGPVDSFLLPRGRPQPRFSIGASMFRRDPPASAMETNAGRKNPR
jgi:hypothetical protein